VVIGDVSGHGVPAGLVMMMTQTAINVTLCKHPDIAPSELLSAVNMTITKNIQLLSNDKYMTITVLNVSRDGRCEFSGLHQDILVYRASTKSVELVKTRGAWIGMLDCLGERLRNDVFILGVDDTALLYTDGITEAMRGGNPDVMFGLERLTETFRGLGEDSTEDIRDGILNSLEGYILHDDVTMVVLRRKG